MSEADFKLIWNALVIGLGKIGMGYDIGYAADDQIRSHARALSLHPKFNLKGAVDSDPSKRRLFRSTYNKPAYSSLTCALESQTSDFAVVSTPTSTHSAIVKQLVASDSIQAILCEKPLAWDLDESREILAMTEERGIPLFVNYIRLSEPGTVEVSHRILNGKILLPADGVVEYCQGLIHSGSHFFNLIEVWLGKMRSFEIIEIGEDLANGDANPDFSAEFERGSVIFRSTKWSETSGNKITLMAQNGVLEYSQGGRLVKWFENENAASFNSREKAIDPEFLLTEFNRYQHHVIEQIARKMMGASCTLCDGSAALQSLASIFAILRGRK